ncbi:zinc finger protein 239-like [Anarrhichthys ocellatus]|uniref:zinc finger protein 239-like n=1 Tax=Anarrhichthys ocellatus TaxID=433405 RepID=UPI0012ED05D0|nr:zinc finger protein 239-like [Anarrhichthys ocellatus]
MSSVFCFRDFVNERLTAAAAEILGVFEKTVVVYEEEIYRQRKLLDVVLKPVIKLHKKKITQSSVCNDKVLADRQLCNQERSSGLDRQDPDPPRIKEEQEELRTSQEAQEADGSKSMPSCAGRDRTLLSDPPTHISVTAIKPESDREGSGVLDPNGVHGLPRNSRRAKGQDQNADRKPEDKRFKCLFCTEQFCDLLKLKVHATTHAGEKRYKCETCGKGFARKALLRKHGKTHAGGKPFGCPVCGKEFNCRSNRATHVKTHVGEKPHACVTCGKGFSRGADLRRHNRTHTGEKPYSCVHCGKGFSYDSSLKNHVRVHTGEKPYKCALCGKGFTVGTTLKIHTRVHTGEKPYKCSVCGRNFAHGTGLRLHGRIHAREKLQSSKLKI